MTADDARREQLMLRELRRFHRDHAALEGPLLAAQTRKRVRVPRVDVDENPFCLARQLADEHERANFNKNPRFYTPTIRSSPRVEENPRNHSSFVNQAADLLASSGFSPRARAEFTGAVPPVAYRPAEFSRPSVVTVDPGELRSIPKDHVLSPERNAIHVTSRHAPPTHVHYGCQRTSPPTSFGHRPESASRMYDPLTSTVLRVKKPTAVRQLDPVSKTPSKAGMSALDLQQLLTPTKASQSQTKSPPESPTTSSPSARSSGSSPPKPIRRRASEAARTQSTDELERGFWNETFYPPKPRKDLRFHAPTDQTTAQLIDKFRKLAVGKLPE